MKTLVRKSWQIKACLQRGNSLFSLHSMEKIITSFGVFVSEK